MIKKNYIASVFDEIFRFNIYNMETNNHIDVALVVYDNFLGEQVIGVVQIGAYLLQ